MNVFCPTIAVPSRNFLIRMWFLGQSDENVTNIWIYKFAMTYFTTFKISGNMTSTNSLCQPGCWHNGSAFVFCPGDCPFESEPSPTSAHACGEVTGCMPATKRLACRAPEVDLKECTLHLPLRKTTTNK